MAAKKISRLDHREIVSLSKSLEKHCSKGNDGFAVYSEGYDDERIAKENSVTTGNVAYLRNAIIGRLRAPKGQDTTNIEARIAALEAWAAGRPVDPFKPAKTE